KSDPRPATGVPHTQGQTLRHAATARYPRGPPPGMGMTRRSAGPSPAAPAGPAGPGGRSGTAEVEGELGAITQAQLAEHAGDVVLDGALGDVQPGGDLPVGRADRDQP